MPQAVYHFLLWAIGSLFLLVPYIQHATRQLKGRVGRLVLTTLSIEPWAGLRRGCGSSLQPPSRSVVTTLSWVLAAVMTGVRGISHCGGGGTISIMSFAFPECEELLPVCLDATG